MILKGLWQRLSNRLINKTPGIGCSDEADEAVVRSQAAVDDSRRTFAQVADSADYLRNAAVQNHFREKIAEIYTKRATA